MMSYSLMPKKDLSAEQQYRKYFHNGDRREIFRLLVERYGVQSAIYPGSYIDIAPSFYIPITVYIDSFKKADKFFNANDTIDFISKNRAYNKTPIIRYHYSDYNLDFGEDVEYFDLLISLYAGFVSENCKKYLKKNGILLANNSHGDAGIAYLDDDFEFVAAIYKSNGQYRLTEKNLDKYFIPKKPELKITKNYLKKLNRGVGYTKTSSAYVFKKIK
ncbi:MAG: hypothetical protein ACFE9S_11290 [Candidatus Hermodarchaeota archaeon]